LVEFIGVRRDANLRLDLEDKVRLVKFEPPSIELRLMPDAPPSLAGELAAKLSKWTGTRWVVIVSREDGQPPLGESRRKREAGEREAVSKDPLLQRVLREFPGAEITTVRPLEPDAKAGDKDSGTGAG